MYYYTYVLKSSKDGRLYIGSTSNLVQRVKQHNAGDVEATKNRRPLNLVYYEAGLDKDKAHKRERYFKTGFGRAFLKNRI
jgi:putative endonuclease